MTQSTSLPELPKPRLLACPFCSGEGRETKEADSDWPSKCFMFIQCTRCGARTANVYGSGDPSEWADARHNWNQRLACYEAGSAAAAQAVPEGFVLVPREPTMDMLNAGAQTPAMLAIGNASTITQLRSGGQLDPAAFKDGPAMLQAYRAMLAVAPTQGAEGAAPQAATMCPCGDRSATQCDEQWGPKCDLGNNAEHAKVYAPAPQAVAGEAIPEPVARVLRYAGKTLRDVRNPNLTARETIVIADWICAALTPSPTPTAPPAAYPGGSAPGYEEKRPVIERSNCALAGGSCNCDPDTVFCPVHNGRAVYAKPATPTAPQEADALREALHGITVYCNDTLSGPVEVPDDRKWYRDGIREVLKRARAALAQHQPQQGEQHE